MSTVLQEAANDAGEACDHFLGVAAASPHPRCALPAINLAMIAGSAEVNGRRRVHRQQTKHKRVTRGRIDGGAPGEPRRSVPSEIDVKTLARPTGFCIDDVFELRPDNHATLVCEGLGLLVKVNRRRAAANRNAGNH
jgi:hypothetical protein